MVRFVRRKSFFITRQKRLQHRDKASAEGFLAMSLMNFWFLQLLHPKNPSTICPWKKENYFAYTVWFKWKMSMYDPPRPYRLCVWEWICIQMWIAQHISHRSHPFSPSLPQALKMIWWQIILKLLIAGKLWLLQRSQSPDKFKVYDNEK